MALHTRSTETKVDTYFSKVMAIVNEQVKVFGELPDLDFGEYVFLNCFMPNASGDGMEHRNSTVVTNSKPLASPLGETSIGTISHEFVHTWNVERIRPASLEPFNFEEANMSGELWFAEGFTSYYTNLILARAGIRTQEEYIEGLSRGINYVFNHPGRQYFNPIEMSYQAPFVDAARSVDPVNRENTFISYYTYGSVLGLALDLSLRELDGNKNLDDFMKLMWNEFGKQEIPYTNRDIEDTLAEYAGIDFATNFFEKYIYDSQMPDYGSLLSQVGVHFGKADPDKASLGTNISVENGIGTLRSNAIKGSPIYNAGIEATDEIISIAGKSLSGVNDVDDILKNHKPGDTIEITFRRWGKLNTVKVALVNDSAYQTGIVNNINERIREKRSDWLD
jgi:predicted metalloprotease with PDZ domain